MSFPTSYDDATRDVRDQMEEIENDLRAHEWPGTDRTAVEDTMHLAAHVIRLTALTQRHITDCLASRDESELDRMHDAITNRDETIRALESHLRNAATLARDIREAWDDEWDDTREALAAVKELDDQLSAWFTP